MTSVGYLFSSHDFGQTNDTLAETTSEFNYSFELHTFDEALSPYGTIETIPPDSATITTNDFRLGEFFRTSADDTHALQLDLEDRVLTLIIDESGSMTWNDNGGQRYIYAKRLLNKLIGTYPGSIRGNLITFGGALTKTTLFLAQSGTDFLTSRGLTFDQFVQSSFQDSVYDFAGVRIVRRGDRFPSHPADGIVISEGIFEAVRDDELIEGKTYYYGVWSFNKNGHFSPGQFIKGVPHDRILPRGVNFASGTPGILPGVKRDDNTILIYNFLEKSGTLIFDSSGGGVHGHIGSEVVEDNFWVGDGASVSHVGTNPKQHTGVRFDGEFDVIETDISDNISAFTLSTSNFITVNFWIYPYDFDKTRWIIGTSTSTVSDNIGWAIGIDTTGNIVAEGQDISLGFTILSIAKVNTNEWSMVTVVFYSFGVNDFTIQVYINGQLIHSPAVVRIMPPNIDTLYIGAKPTDSGSSWNGFDFFGVIGQVSVHNTARTSEYINSLYNDELPIFQQTTTSWNSEPPDNKQREVLLNWEIGSDYDYQGGTVKIVRKYSKIPAQIDDGETVVEIDAEPGEFFYMDSYNFVHNETYYYKVFTTNSIGNSCNRTEARTIGVKIPKSVNTAPVPSLDPVDSETVIEGNKKLLLQWESPSDSRWRGTKIYYHPDHFPTINSNSKGDFSSDGDLILDTQDPNKKYFAHRVLGSDPISDIPLANGYLHYYTLVTYDEFRRFSEPRFLVGIPSSQLDTVFGPEDVEDLHLEVLNPISLSLQWRNPTLRSERLELYFGELALVFVDIKDIYGAELDDIDNLKLEVCTSFEIRSIKARGSKLGNDSATYPPGSREGGLGNPTSGYEFTEGCNSEEEAAETVLTYATIESGLVKGLLGHTLDRDILARRESYTMNIRAKYVVYDPDSRSEEPLFSYYTPGASVVFIHPIRIAILNKLNKKCQVSCGERGRIRGSGACQCPDESENECRQIPVDGGYIGAVNPYVVRIELQYKGEALPDGTSINVELFEHYGDLDKNFLKIKSTKTFIREGSYQTSAILSEELNQEGKSTGVLVSKSIVDIDIKHPTEPDWLDIYVSLDYAGLYVDAISTFRFVGTVFISSDITQPSDNGIEVSEQFATVWSLDPDFPDDPTKTLPAPDGTVVKWEIIKGQYGKDRPFYSTEELPSIVSGVYSTTTSGVARNVFFGPVGQVESHNVLKSCGDESSIDCCVGEEYTIKSSVILGEESAYDAMIFWYECDAPLKFTNKRFFINAASGQPGPGSPHYITWADGEHLLHFQIARNPITIEADPQLDMLEVSKFNSCVDSIVGGENFGLPLEHIVTVTAPGEILWDVIFEEEKTDSGSTQSDGVSFTNIPLTYQSISPEIAAQLGVPFAANIPIRGEVTDFYMRYNVFIGDGANPKPMECNQSGDEVDLLDCEYRNICDGSEEADRRWNGVGTMNGRTTIIVNNKPVTLLAGGDYEDGMFPIKVGWKEPLDVKVIEARLPDGTRAHELIVDGSTRHTFVAEVTFAGQPVPDGTRLELDVVEVSGDVGVVRLSNCAGVSESCSPASNGIIYTRKVNDPRLNPGDVDQRSLAYFTIEGIANVAFNAKINVTCRYDKLGTATREITRCVELNNTINISQPDIPPVDPETGDTGFETKASSNEAIVYDTITDNYERVSGANIDRIAHFSGAVTTGTTDRIFLIGGFTAQGDGSFSEITPLCEEYDVARDEWYFIADMPTPRVAGQTVVHGGKIYCIGGLSQDPLLDSTYIVSRKLEVYDTLTGVWNDTLQDMPVDKGVAFGNAQVYGNYIYVTCGANSVSDSIFSGSLNKSILRYDILEDSWTILSPSSEELYPRLYPFGFSRNVKNTISSDVLSVNDDGYSKNDGAITLGGSTLYLGKIGADIYDIYLRFQINIPSFSVVNSAHISLIENDFGGLNSDTLAYIKLLNSSNVSSFGDVTPVGQSTTDTYLPVQILAGGDLAVQTLDITSLVQEFIDMPGYSPGNYMCIKLDGELETGAHSIRFYCFALYPPSVSVDYSGADYYIYSGSIPRNTDEITAERNSIIDRLINEFRTESFVSPYYLNLSPSEQENFIKDGESSIREGVEVPAFIYPSTGFIMKLGSENSNGVMDISNTLDNQWPVLPKPRDRGQAVYIPRQDIVYFMGGSNQNKSTTLNRVESIDLGNDNAYSRLTPFSRGRAMFAAVALDDDIYLSGGITSGHKQGWVKVEVTQSPEYVAALGEESSGVLIKLVNDSGEIINQDVRVSVRGIVHIPEIDDKIKNFLANRGADRALGGTGSGNAPNLPQEGDELDLSRLIEAQNKITDPNSDAFQFNAARKLGEEIYLFPVLYSNTEVILSQGIGAVTLKPRSEDPLSDFQKLAEFIDTVLQNTPEDTTEKFEGDLTRDELASLGEILSTITAPSTVITSGSVRKLYSIETKVTILDDIYFGENVSDFDLDIQEEIRRRIEEKLTPPIPDNQEDEQDGLTGVGISGSAGSEVKESECLLLQHLAQSQRDTADQGPGEPERKSTPRSSGKHQTSGQCKWCAGLLPTQPNIDIASKTTYAYYYNCVDWIPQVRRRYIDNNTTLEQIKSTIDIIDHETPFGGSQLYNAMFEAGRIMSGETLDSIKKSIYICSDNSQNLSLVKRRDAIEEINSVDGDRNVPVVYTVFSTSFPVSVSSMLERSEVGDVAKITKETGGQSTTLVSSEFMDQILNLTVGSATGGLGYGIYTNRLIFTELTAITSMTTNFTLPLNTQGLLRFRYSSDGYNFGDWSERFEGNQYVDFTDFFAKIVEFEVVLSTGFSENITEEYDSTPTGVPKLNSIVWDTSGEREDFIYVNTEEVLTNVQQLAGAFEGSIPTNAIVEIGAATSGSHDWRDFQTAARPAIREFGKMFMLERTDSENSVVAEELLTTKDQQLYTSAYGPWDPKSVVTVFEAKSNGDVPVLSGFVLYPREGQLYFKTRQDPSKSFKITIVNSNALRVGIRLRNRLHTDSISVSGVGYIYSTNDEKPDELSQVAPRAISASISPAAPVSTDTIFALYTYIDLNNDKESGTIISWFKNGKQLFEIQNKTSWTNDDLLHNNKLEPNDKLQFSITPSDGRDFGATAFSPTVSIVAQQPGAANTVIIYTRDSVRNDRPDTSSRLEVQYTFTTDDTGSAAVETGTLVTWFVNGIKWKEGTYSQAEENDLRIEWSRGVSASSGRSFETELDNIRAALYIDPGDFEGGILAHIIGNQIYAEVTPRTLVVTGSTVRSNTVTIVNSIPKILNITVSPSNPTAQSTLIVTYTIDDVDFNQNQTDQSEIRWYRSMNGVDFVEVESVRGKNSVPPSVLVSGNQWYVEITPFDGLDINTPKRSTTITIA